MMIEIRGVQFVNKGAELMLWAILKELADIFPNAEYCMQPRQTAPYRKRANIGAYQKLNFVKGTIDLNRLSYFIPKAVRNYLKRAWGIVTEADIAIVLDASGFRYGDQWPVHDLKMLAREVKRLKKKSKHFVFLPQALGPFNDNQTSKYARISFENAALVCARESKSLTYVRGICSTDNIVQAPDFTNLLEVSLLNEYARYRDCVAVIPNSKMVGEQNANQYWRENYISILTSIIKTLQAKRHEVFLLNHEGKKDEVLCQTINAELCNKVVIVTPPSAKDVKAIIGNAKFTISSRFHGCVSSLSQGVPCIATSWSHKYEELFSEYGQAHCILDEHHDGANQELFLDDFVKEIPKSRDILMKKAEIYKSQSRQMWQLLKEKTVC